MSESNVLIYVTVYTCMYSLYIVISCIIHTSFIVRVQYVQFSSGSECFELSELKRLQYTARHSGVTAHRSDVFVSANAC